MVIAVTGLPHLSTLTHPPWFLSHITGGDVEVYVRLRDAYGNDVTDAAHELITGVVLPASQLASQPGVAVGAVGSGELVQEGSVLDQGLGLYRCGI